MKKGAINNEERRQTFEYKGKEYQYRINSGSLRKMEAETGIRISTTTVGTSEGRAKMLYYCTCWKEERVTLERFLRDWKFGLVSFRPGKKEYSMIGLSLLFRSKIINFKKKGEL